MTGARIMFREAFQMTPRLVRVALLTLALAACKKDAATGPSATPAAVRLQGANGQNAQVGSTLSIPLTVVVTDASGKSVSGARVDWDAGVGAGTATPASSNSNSDGVAQTTWTLGTVAGSVRLTAQVNGLSPIVFTAIATAGATASVVATPDRAFLGQGDTIRIRAGARDQFGNDLTGQPVSFSTLDAVAGLFNARLVTVGGVVVPP